MRVIESKMLKAINSRHNFNLGNTSVHYIQDCDYSEVYLHGNMIAIVYHNSGTLEVNKTTLSLWPTPTTKSRLRALGANVTTKKYITYLNGVAV